MFFAIGPSLHVDVHDISDSDVELGGVVSIDQQEKHTKEKRKNKKEDEGEEVLD